MSTNNRNQAPAKASPPANDEAASAESGTKTTIAVALAVNQACNVILSTGIAANKKFVWALIRNRDRLKALAEGYEEQRQRILKQYVKLDKAGNIEPDESNNAKFKSKADEEKFQKEFAELLEMDADVEFYKVSFDHVPDDIAAMVLAQLEPILVDAPA